jgi:hypothetical protein
MIEDPREGDSFSVRLGRPRPRFGLKTAFVVMTVLCVWLGWRSVRERRIAEMHARRESVVAALEKVFTTSRPGIIKDGRWSPEVTHRRNLGGDGTAYIRHVSADTERLQIVQPLIDQPIVNIVKELLAAYEPGLTAAGLHREIIKASGSTSSDNFGHAYGGTVWVLPEHGLTVSLDAQVDREQVDTIGRVNVVFIHNERVSFW